MKKCFECGESKPLEEFNKRSVCSDGFNPRCKTCTTSRHREWCAANRDKVKIYNSQRTPRSPEYERERWHTRRKFSSHGLTQESYGVILDAQGGACAICRDPTRGMQIDHDHSCCDGPFSCGRCVRGLLCGGCNKALGGFNDDPALLRRAANYLESFSTGVRQPITAIRNGETSPYGK